MAWGELDVYGVGWNSWGHFGLGKIPGNGGAAGDLAGKSEDVPVGLRGVGAVPGGDDGRDVIDLGVHAGAERVGDGDGVGGKFAGGVRVGAVGSGDGDGVSG